MNVMERMIRGNMKRDIMGKSYKVNMVCVIRRMPKKGQRAAPKMTSNTMEKKRTL